MAIDSHPRRHVHTRSIRVDAYVRDDGLWDLEAVLIDTKSRDLQLASGVRAAGEPVHELGLRVTVDEDLNIRDARASAESVPYPGFCERIAPEYGCLVGLNLMRDFRRGVRERLGGVRGCSHLTELADVLPTAAIQGFAGEVSNRRGSASGADGREERKPFQLDRCHALVTSGAAVARFYPRWFQPSGAPNDNVRGDTP